MAADDINRNAREYRDEYTATAEELTAIDAAMASIDAGQVATDEEIKAAFAKFRRMG